MRLFYRRLERDGYHEQCGAVDEQVQIFVKDLRPRWPTPLWGAFLFGRIIYLLYLKFLGNLPVIFLKTL